MRRQIRGFTLIELLVVVAIITLLAAIILASVNLARSKARDARRFADLRQFQTALELYYANHGTYPAVACAGDYVDPLYPNFTGWAGDFTGPLFDYIPCQNALQAALAPYIAKLPVDPINYGEEQGDGSVYGYLYWYGSVRNGSGYVLTAYPEVTFSVGEGCYYPQASVYCVGENWE